MTHLIDIAFWAVWGLSLLAYAYVRRSLAMVTVFFITVTAVLATNLLEIELIRPYFAAFHRCRGLCASEIGLPSNHTARAAAAAVVLLLACRSVGWRALAVLVALGVGVSRVYLGVHRPGDIMWAVLFGATIGAFYYVLLAPPSRA